MEHVNDWCFRDIYKGGLWEDDLYVCAQEQNVEFYMTFVDLTKSFDSVSRGVLWTIMAKFGWPARFKAKIQQFHFGMLARVQNEGEYSESFPVTNGVKQGYVLYCIGTTCLKMLFVTLMVAFQ